MTLGGFESSRAVLGGRGRIVALDCGRRNQRAREACGSTRKRISPAGSPERRTAQHRASMTDEDRQYEAYLNGKDNKRGSA